MTRLITTHEPSSKAWGFQLRILEFEVSIFGSRALGFCLQLCGLKNVCFALAEIVMLGLLLALNPFLGS